MAVKKVSLRKPFLSVGAILLILGASFLWMPGLNTSSRSTKLVVHRGMGYRSIVGELQRNGSITSTWPVLLTGSILPKLHNIKPGRYTIPPGMSNFALLYFLHTHPQDEVRITLPEGLSLERVAHILSSKLDIDSTEFVAAASSRPLLRRNGITAPNAEGYLFPGTYNFAWASSPQYTAEFLIGRFRKFYTDRLKTAASQQGLSETELLSLASIVEAETPLDLEKPLVASVYLNRLKKKMRLQADPTVQYALGGTARHLYYKDLAADSPYNTYRHNGLPPGPICNPGSAAIQAVLNPANTSFLYFVATGKGGHNFASSLQEHEKNIQNYKRARRESLR